MCDDSTRGVDGGRDPGRLIRANLHTHSHASAGSYPPPFDHNLSPEPALLLQEAEQYGLDCVAITDHAEEVTQPEWEAEGVAVADPPGDLIALRAFEWTLSTAFGAGDHLNVFGTSTKAYAKAKCIGAGCGDAATSLPALYAWLHDREAATGERPVAQLNHLAMAGPHFDGFTLPAEDLREIITLAELAVTRPLTQPDKVEAFALRPPWNILDGERYWRSALQRGWRVAPTLNADNDGGLEQSVARFHTGIFLLPGAEPTVGAVLEALRRRRVFASQDGDAEVRLWYGEYFMGSTDVAVRRGSSFRLSYHDPEAAPRLDLWPEYSVAVVNGREQALPEARREGDSWVWDLPAPDAPGDYYLYVRLRQRPHHVLSDGDYVLTAPIWFRVGGA